MARRYGRSRERKPPTGSGRAPLSMGTRKSKVKRSSWTTLCSTWGNTGFQLNMSRGGRRASRATLQKPTISKQVLTLAFPLKRMPWTDLRIYTASWLSYSSMSIVKVSGLIKLAKARVSIALSILLQLAVEKQKAWTPISLKGQSSGNRGAFHTDWLLFVFRYRLQEQNNHMYVDVSMQPTT
jgi:hypothetical protein